MFCRYCGNEITEDSLFCPYCGKNLSSDIKENNHQATRYYEQAHTKSTQDIAPPTRKPLHSGFHDICFFLSLGLYIVFFVLYKDIDPTAWLGNYTTYLIVIVVGIVVFFYMALHANTNAKSLLLLIIPLTLVIACSILNLIYNQKIQTAQAVPLRGNYTYMYVDVDDKYYNSTGTGQVKDPYIQLKFGDEKVRNSVVKVQTSIKTAVTAEVSYIWMYNGTIKGNGSTTISISESEAVKGKTFSMEFPTQGDQSCKLNVRLSRALGFWDVVLS